MKMKNTDKNNISSQKYSEIFKPENLVGNFRFLSGNNNLDKRISVKKIKELLSVSKPLSYEDNTIINKILKSLSNDRILPYNWSPQESNFLDMHSEDDWISSIYRYKFKIQPKNLIKSDFLSYVLIEPASVVILDV